MAGGTLDQVLSAKERSGVRTWNLFLELPGLVKSLFSPTLREPSFMACELDLNGSGAASLDVFWERMFEGLIRRKT